MTMAAIRTGKVICAGLGPGDPDLISVKSDRVVRGAKHVAYFRKAGRKGQARQLVEGMLRADAIEYPMEYPVTTELPFDGPDYISLLSRFYDDWAQRLAKLAQTEEVVVLCEGDPFLYGSFQHIWSRLRGVVEVEVIAGIPGMVGCWNSAGLPITWGDDILTVLAGTLPEAVLCDKMRGSDALVIMKTGRNLPKVARALVLAGRFEDAVLVENGTMAGQRIRPMAQVDATDCPYFAIVLVHGHGRRPEREGAQ
jgi:precorrin-2/cobalt-factor-2 C20-methyltransferase